MVAREHAFPIVGIGASAGGLAAFEAFFTALPSTPVGMAFVLVQHLDPDHNSILAELIQRSTSMVVVEAEEEMLVEPDCVYIIPPNRDMILDDGVLRLEVPNAPRGHRAPIDLFFRSLASDQRDRAVCIVLSGTGSDGAAGVRAVRAEGGLVLAQRPESTEFDGMPRSAIATGCVDSVLSAEEMPARLLDYVSRSVLGGPLTSAQSAPQVAELLDQLFVILRQHTGHDFSQYKRNTIVRRVERRMAVAKLDRLEEYVHYLQQTPTEVDLLFGDLLIGVTSFFRDPEAFKVLETEVIPKLFDGKTDRDSVRIWAPGCSTGEEAYSIAILVRERIDALKQSFKVQLFATDVDPAAIQQARAGVFSGNIETQLSAERLRRFFVADQQTAGYRIQKGIRDLLIFSEHDALRSPPFSRMDLIVCRNLLIYLGPELQAKLLSTFHYALRPGGFLFLGNSESVGDLAESFTVVDRKAKIFRRGAALVDHRRPSMARLPSTRDPDHGPAIWPMLHRAGEAKRSLRRITERELLNGFAPVGALVDASGAVLYLHGRTGRYLEPAPGESDTSITKMAREGLRRELKVALHKAAATRSEVREPGLRVKTNGDYTLVNLRVRPVGNEADPELFLITFEDAPEPAHRAVALAPGAELAVEDLKQELLIKEEFLQSTIEELEAANDELRSANEELQSTNEELQSTNEELETSKEELQSVNEELATVNVELREKITELSSTSNDLNNLLAGTGIGTVFVDHELRVRRFTPAATQIINLIPADVGRPVGHIVSNLIGYDHLVEDLQAVLDDLIPKEVEVETKQGAWYSLRIRPYRTLENVIEGAVISFLDITAIKRAEQVQRELEQLRRSAAEAKSTRSD